MHGHAIVLAIAEAIAPYVGGTMARSSVEAHCKRLGIDAEKLDRLQAEPLLRQIALGLNIFIGREKTEAVIAKIRTAIGSSS
jgi:hypothetical protein